MHADIFRHAHAVYGVLILRAAAHAASSVACAASRCARAAAAAAAAARSGSGGAAAVASDPPVMRASSVAVVPATARSPAPASCGSVVHPHVAAARPSRSRLVATTLPPPFDDGPLFAKPDGWVDFEADEKDLESDEALWALYQRWCKYFNEERDHDEMVRRFSAFKETVLSVEENKRSDLPYRLGLAL